MGLIDVARDTLKEIPMADILRERLLLALDQSSAQEKKIESLQAENAELKAELKIARRDVDKKEKELYDLRSAHAEDIRIFEGIEFRRGARTGGVWQPFCPKCHCPAQAREEIAYVTCTDNRCEWYSSVYGRDLARVISKL